MGELGRDPPPEMPGEEGGATGGGVTARPSRWGRATERGATGIMTCLDNAESIPA
jgi:hypothetical protein